MKNLNDMMEINFINNILADMWNFHMVLLFMFISKYFIIKIKTYIFVYR